MDDGDPIVTLEAFAILKPFLPVNTKLTSTYRSPEHQLKTILDLATQAKLAITKPVVLNQPSTWLPILARLRELNYDVNAPLPGTKIPISPHTKSKCVFDLAGPDLQAIKNACSRAEEEKIMGFAQKRVEPKNHAVHLEVSWISHRQLIKLYEIQGYAIT